MTILFWLIAATMVLVAVSIVLIPLLRAESATQADDLDQRNINIARERLTGLKANLAAGGISQGQYDEQVAELELALSDDLELASPAVKAQGQGRWLAYVLLVAVPVLSAGLYWILGDYGAITRAGDPGQMAQADETNAGMPSPEAINQMVVKLSEKLKSEPNNLEGWLMLGRSYKVLQRYRESVEAFAQANKIAGEKTEVMLPYAEALALVGNGNWSGLPKELVMKVLAKEPEHPGALWFAALLNAQQGDKKTAVTYLKKLEAILPADSPDKQQIHEIIVNTGGESARSSAKPEPSGGGSNTVVTIQVGLAAELQSEAKPEDTVFIYAQALSGPKMPLAIIRKRVSELPLTVNLSDADSMMSNMRLSAFKDVRLLARISKSGTAMPQAGDLIGTVESVKLADKSSHKIVINSRVD